MRAPRPSRLPVTGSVVTWYWKGNCVSVNTPSEFTSAKRSLKRARLAPPVLMNAASNTLRPCSSMVKPS